VALGAGLGLGLRSASGWRLGRVGVAGVEAARGRLGLPLVCRGAAGAAWSGGRIARPRDRGRLELGQGASAGMRAGPEAGQGLGRRLEFLGTPLMEVSGLGGCVLGRGREDVAAVGRERDGRTYLRQAGEGARMEGIAAELMWIERRKTSNTINGENCLLMEIRRGEETS
jgi:hypothetical protein